MADATKLNEMWDRLKADPGRGRSAAPTPTARPAPSPGDVYVWPPPNDLGLDWVVVSGHADDPAAVYVVPADGHPLAGLADVVVRETGREALYLRCGRGLWVRHADLSPERRYRVLDPHHLLRAQEKVRQIAVGPLDGSSAAWENEADPDYAAWMAEVTAAVLTLTAPGGERPVTLTDRDFTPWSAKSARARAAEPALAASGSDPFAELLAPPTGDFVLAASSLPFGGPGGLRVVREAGGVAVVFEAQTTEEPPPIAAADSAGQWRPLTWNLTPDRSAARATAPWIEGRVRLRVGSDPSAREVVVPKP